MIGALLLGEVADRTAMLDISCNRCERRGRAAVASLLARHGRRYPMTQLRRVVAHDCARWQSDQIYEQCGVCFPQLPELFAKAGNDRTDQ